ncbi:MAG: hypothetical protein FWG25_00735 [Promicromonosporaceae bacterium]|nr:hypothetical protein [Promicromonosporaceae bacterium]
MGELLTLTLPKAYFIIWRARQSNDPVKVVSETARKITITIPADAATELRLDAEHDMTVAAGNGLDSKAAAHLRTSAQSLLAALVPAPKASRARTEKRMSGAELQARREFLGLTQAGLAGLLGVQTKSVEIWELGSNPVPYDMDSRLAPIEEATRKVVAVLVARIKDGVEIVLYRKDGDFQSEQLGHLGLDPALPLSAFGSRWWRQLVIRAVGQTPATKPKLVEFPD